MKKRIWVAAFLTLIVLLPWTLSGRAATISDAGLDFTESGGNAKLENGKITMSATGWSIIITGFANTQTVTLTNNTDVKQVLSGEMKFTGSFGEYKVTLDGTTITSGTSAATYNEKITMAIGSELVISITSPKGNKTISCTYEPTVTASSEKTIVCHTVANGSYSVNNTTVAEDGMSVSFAIGDTITLATNPDSGYVCLGFLVEETGGTTLLPVDTSGSIDWTPINGCSITPVFSQVSDTTAPFSVGGKKYYTWETAITAAGTAGTVILNSTYTLPTTYAAQGMSGAGEYVSGTDGALVYSIPLGVKFLVPCSATDAGMFGPMVKGTYASTASPTTYRTLTVPEGIQIDCTGELNVNGQRRESGQGANGTGVPRGGHGKLILQGSGTQLKINGSLYCYGFVTGTGTVEVSKTGATYELMQIYDWPGGTNFAGSIGLGGWNSKADANTLFFCSRYYVQNIEAPLIAYNGSSMNMEVVITAGGETVASSCKLVGSGGLFQLSGNTYIMRSYDSKTDRIMYTSGGSGDVTIGSITITATVMKITKSIKSSDYILPISSAMTIHIGKGTRAKLNYDFAILPGSEMIVDQGAKLEVSGELFVFDKSDMTADMSFGSQIAPLYTAGRGTTAALKIEHSGRLEVNGTLEIISGGGLYTTTAVGGTASANIDKKIYGFGKIIHNGSTSGKTIKAGYNETLISITVSNALGLIEGSSDNETDLKAFGKNTYYGTGEFGKHYWYVPSLPVHSTAAREDDGFTIDAEYRLQDYLWLNAVCYLGEKTSPIDLSAGSVKVYTLNPDGSVCVNRYANGEFTEDEGVQILAVNGAIYLIKKIPADEIPDDITFRIEYTDANNGLYRSSQFTVCLEDCKTDDESDTTTNPLVDALLAYGEAAKKYFVTSGAPDTKLDPESIRNSLADSTEFSKTPTVSASGSYNKNGTTVTLTTKGANVLFEERLSLMFGFQFSVKNMTEDDILQVGVLVGSSDLTTGMTVGAENITAYILYNRGGFTGTGTNMPDLPEGANYKVNDKASVTWDKLNAGGRMVLYMDLLSVDYTSAIEFRPYAIAKDGTVIYGQQYAYGLADYINNMLYLDNQALKKAIGDKNADAFRNLLITTWNYALKADAKFANN